MSDAAKKAKAAPKEHPTYQAMVAAAVGALKERTGSSRHAIKKYVKGNYQVKDNADIHINKALKALLAKEAIVQAKGCFKLAKKAKEPAKKKPAAAKKPKAAEAKKSVKKTPAKKAAAKKAKSPKKAAKKPAAKKPASKKVKKSPKKAATKAKKPVAKKSAKKPAKKATKAKK